MIEGAGLTVYPGLIDMGSSTGIERRRPAAAGEPPDDRRGRALEARRRSSVLTSTPRRKSGAEAPEVARYANAGITSVLVCPGGAVVKGQSALVNVAGPVDEPPVGNVGDYRRGLQVVERQSRSTSIFRTAHAATAYPASLLGVISFRAAELSRCAIPAAGQPALRAREVRLRRDRTTIPALDALQPALQGKVPVAFEVEHGAGDRAVARDGEGVQARSGDLRRARGGPGGGRPQDTECPGDLQHELP